MGKGQSVAAQVCMAASGDSGEFLEQDFLAECVEGQVPPDVGANGSNLGKGEGRWGGGAQAERKQERVRYKQQRAVPEAQGQDAVLEVSLLGNEPLTSIIPAGK